MADDSSIRSYSTTQNVPISSSRNVPLEELGHILGRRKYIKRTTLEDLAIERTSKGITWEDIRDKFSCSKDEAQRKLKHLYSKRVLFTAQDLIDQGLDLPPTFRNRNPQRYYARSKKADIIEEIKKECKNVPVHPTGVTISKSPLSNTLELQKAQSFLDVLCSLGKHTLYIHKLHLQLSVPSEYYHTAATIVTETLPQAKKNKGKEYLERMARGDVNFIIYPNGKVMVSVACSNNPFKLETDEDEGNLFSFLGQVRDRLLYVLNDPRERAVPSIMEWHLSECDINKDIEISDMMQLSSIDIQLKYADRVFRQYVKSLHDKAVYRCEESLAFKSTPIVEALEQIRNPYKALENKIDNIAAAIVGKQLSRKVDSILNCKAIGYNEINN
jgi:hypothetical protein